MKSKSPSLGVRKAQLADLNVALNSGIRDFLKAPKYGLFFGFFYALGGLALVYGTIELKVLWLAYPLVIGFALVGPFVATGLYEVSRRLENNLTLSWRDILGVIWLQRRRELGWMAFVILFIFWIWMYQVRTLVAVFFGFSGFADFERFVETVLTTPDGWMFLAVGHVVGAVISLTLFVLTVISCPLLLEKDVDFVTAMLTSIRAVFKSPLIMLGWGAFVIIAILVSAIPAFIPFVFILPILGHATWHLYRRLVFE